MAEIERLQLSVKVQALDTFQDLIAALAAWAEEAQRKPMLSEAEQRLFNAAIEADDAAKERTQ